MRDCVVALHSAFGSFNSFACMLLTFVHFFSVPCVFCVCVCNIVSQFGTCRRYYDVTSPHHISVFVACCILYMVARIHFVCVVTHLIPNAFHQMPFPFRSTRINLQPSNTCSVNLCAVTVWLLPIAFGGRSSHRSFKLGRMMCVLIGHPHH